MPCYLPDNLRMLYFAFSMIFKYQLRSNDVREMLNISDSTLQTFRINGIIPAYKLDSTWFYKYDEIVGALEKGRNR